jgi:hypothetical protein
MSSEVVVTRKRGRPRKVEKAEEEVQEIQAERGTTRKKAASAKKLQDIDTTKHPQKEQSTKPQSSAVRKRTTATKNKISDSVSEAGQQLLKSAKRATTSTSTTARTATTVTASSSLSSSKILQEIKKQRETESKDDEPAVHRQGTSDHRDPVLAAAEVSDQQQKIAIEEAIASSPKDRTPELSASDRKSEPSAEAPKSQELDSVAATVCESSLPEERLTSAKKRKEVPGSSTSATKVSGKTTKPSQSALAAVAVAPAPSSKILSALTLEKKKKTAKHNNDSNNNPLATPTDSSGLFISLEKAHPNPISMAKANGQPPKPKVLSPQEIKELGSSTRRVPPTATPASARPTDIRQTKEYKVAARR